MKRLCISEFVDEVPFTKKLLKIFDPFTPEIFRSSFAIADIAMNMQAKFSEPQN